MVWHSCYMNTGTQRYYRENEVSRLVFTIQFSQKFATNSISLEILGYFINSVIRKSFDDSCLTAHTGKATRQIRSGLNAKNIESLLKFQRSTLSRLNGVHRRCRAEKKEETILHLLSTNPSLCLRRKKPFSAYYFKNLCEVSGLLMGSLNSFLQCSDIRREIFSMAIRTPAVYMRRTSTAIATYLPIFY